MEINKIEPIIPQDIFKIFNDEISTILNSISIDYDIDDKELIEKYAPNVLNMSIKLGVKKRNKRVLPNEVRCMGRKIDGEQCTRSRRNGCEYCLSHQKSLPHGRIDDNNYVKKVKGKRGRKKKSIENDYIATRIEEINGTEYLVDDYDNVFTYDLNNSKFLGKKSHIQSHVHSKDNNECDNLCCHSTPNNLLSVHC